MRTRIFRIVLAACPRAFRDRFAGELLATAEMLDRSRPAQVTEWPGIVSDALVTVRTIRREMRGESLYQPRRKALVMNSLWQDVQVAARGLRRDASFTLFVVVTLTLGIGANAAMFGIVDRLLLGGPRYVRDSDAVVRLYLTTQPAGMRRFTTAGFGNVMYDLMRGATQSFDGLATYAIDNTIVGTGLDTHLANFGYATGSLFPVLGVQPLRGRFFTDAENRPEGAERVVVLGYGAWQAWFGGADRAVGQPITLGTHRYTIVGIAPPGFTGPQLSAVDLWLPMNLKSAAVTDDWRTTWTAQWLDIVGRLKPGVTRQAAGEELTSILRRGYTGDEPYVRTGQMSVAGLSADESGGEPAALAVVRWLTAVAAIVLVIACANVANLLLARGMRRAREIALRSALGAGGWRIVRFLLVESSMLALAGAVGGLVVADLVGGLVRRVIFPWVDWSTSPVDARVLVASMALGILTGLAVGLLPAWQATRANLMDALKRGARDGRGRRSRARATLTIVQAALSVVLLIGAGLFVRSLWRAHSAAVGFDPDRVLTANIAWPSLAGYPEGPARDAERARRNAFSRDVLGAVRAIPGVEHASAAVGMPFGNRFTVQLRVPGLASVPRLSTGAPGVSAVADDYFATTGTRILRGRAFEASDHAGTEPVAIVSQTMASTVWPGQDPIGQCLISGRLPAPCARIVGIAEDTRQTALREPPSMHYYIPYGQEVGFGGSVLLVRATGDPHELGAAVRQALMSHDARILYVDLSTLREHLDPLTQSWRIGATVFTAAGFLALIVAAVGLYSVMAYLVADRTQEIGVRLALGARSSDIASLILRGGVGMAAIGIGLGAGIALVASRRVAPLLFDVSPRDPVVYGGVAIALIGVAIGAGVVPMLRARRIDAVVALRAE